MKRILLSIFLFINGLLYGQEKDSLLFNSLGVSNAVSVFDGAGNSITSTSINYGWNYEKQPSRILTVTRVNGPEINAVTVGGGGGVKLSEYSSIGLRANFATKGDLPWLNSSLSLNGRLSERNFYSVSTGLVQLSDTGPLVLQQVAYTRTFGSLAVRPSIANRMVDGRANPSAQMSAYLHLPNEDLISVNGSYGIASIENVVAGLTEQVENKQLSVGLWWKKNWSASMHSNFSLSYVEFKNEGVRDAAIVQPNFGINFKLKND